MRKLALVLLLASLTLAIPAAAGGVPLTASRDWWPVWSPNDREVAFTRINGTGRIFSLEVLHLRTHRVSLIGMSAGQLSPTWSPDSKRIAYASGGFLYIANADGTGKHRYPAPAKAYAPAWRPGSTQLAYLTTHGAANADLWVGDEQWAANVVGQPSWVPGKNELAFARDDGIYVAASRASQLKLVTVANPGSPVGSPDGIFVAYAADRYVWIVRADGTGGGSLRLAGPFDDLGPLSWSRESNSIAYTVRGAVEVTNLATYKTVRLAGTVGVGTAFAHHGESLAFSGSHPGCTGHASIRIYADNSHIPSLTGGCGIAGTARADVIYGTAPGGDIISAGAGDDRIHARNGHRDRVICGSGHDTVWADRSDRLSGCELAYPLANA
jgi:Tol biopolymer transport system component